VVFQLGNVQGRDRNDVDHSKKYKRSSQSKCPGETRSSVDHWEEHKGCRVGASLNFSKEGGRIFVGGSLVHLKFVAGGI